MLIYRGVFAVALVFDLLALAALAAVVWALARGF
jgi:hypothetical protein